MASTTIRKAVITEFGDESKVKVIQDTIDAPAADHVQIATIYSGFSGADINMRKGVYPLQKSAPLTPGYCLVGTAELVNIPEKYLVRVPNGLDLQQATALVLDWGTAYAMVHEHAKVAKGQRVFVHGVSGAVGFALMKLCQLQGAEVYGTASERNHAAVRAEGGHPFVYTDKNWMAAMKEMGGADAVFDPLGFESWDESWTILSKSGMLIGFGGNLNSLGGDGKAPRSTVVPTMKLLARGMVPFCPKRTWFYYITRDDATFEPNLKAMFGLLGEGKIRVPIKKVWDLEDVQDAHRQWASGTGVGSLIIRVGDAKQQ
uniref:Alcohol dehydrogenase zinc-binding domain protein n=1 Tax=Colletotrichum fructicola (strain Nara gc5) TaxID=1213859 RepID=L2FAU1_COLFN